MMSLLHQVGSLDTPCHYPNHNIRGGGNQGSGRKAGIWDGKRIDERMGWRNTRYVVLTCHHNHFHATSPKPSIADQNNAELCQNHAIQRMVRATGGNINRERFWGI